MPGPIIENVEIKKLKSGGSQLIINFNEGASEEEKASVLEAVPYIFSPDAKTTSILTDTLIGDTLDMNIAVTPTKEEGVFILSVDPKSLTERQLLDIKSTITNLGNNDESLSEYQQFAAVVKQQEINNAQAEFEKNLAAQDISVSDDVVAEPVAEAKVEPVAAEPAVIAEVKIEPVKTKPEASSEVTIAAKQTEQLNVNSFASIVSEPSAKAPERTIPDIAEAALKGVLSQADLSALKPAPEKTETKEESVLAANTAVEEPKTGAKAPGKLVSSNSNAFSFKKPAAEQPALETEVLAAVAPVAEEVKVAPATISSPAPVVEETKVTKEQITAIDTLNNYINSGKVLGYKAGYNGNAEEVAAVKELQTALVALGYDIGKTGVDGKYGDKTKAAVVEFQTSQALYADGIYGEKSNGKLNAVFAAVEQTKAVDIVYDAAKAGVTNVAVGTVADKGTGLSQK